MTLVAGNAKKYRKLALLVLSMGAAVSGCRSGSAPFRDQVVALSQERIDVADLNLICYDTVASWRSLEGVIHKSRDSIQSLLLKSRSLSRGPREDMDLQRAVLQSVAFFSDQPHDCIVAFPASFSYRRRLEVVRLFKSAGRRRVSTSSEIAALGFGHSHLTLDKSKEQYSTKLFVIATGRYLSVTLAELGYRGVIEVHGSSGAMVEGSADPTAVADLAARLVTSMPQILGTAFTSYDEIVLSGFQDAEETAQRIRALYNAPTVSVFDGLVDEGLLTQVAVFKGIAEDDLLLAATPQSPLGLVLDTPTNTQNVARISVNATKVLLGANEHDLLGGISGGERFEVRSDSKTVAAKRFIEMVPPFTIIPTEKTVELRHAEATRLTVTEYDGAEPLALDTLESRLLANRQGGHFEVEFDIDANMIMTILVKDLATGETEKLLLSSKPAQAKYSQYPAGVSHP